MTQDPNDVVRVYAGSPVMAALYQVALDEAGVTSRMVGAELVGTLGSLVPAEVELWVHRGDQRKAEDAIDRESRPGGGSDQPRQHFPHPTDTPKPAPPPVRKRQHVNPDPGA